MNVAIRTALVIVSAAFLSSVAWTQEDIHSQAAAGNLENVAGMLELNPELIGATNAEGMTPLHAAVGGGRLDVVSFLLAKEADADAADNRGNSALHYAADAGRSDLVTLLLSKGASADQANREGNTPLHFACVEGHLEVAGKLLGGGANINAQNGYGHTALNLAVIRDRLSVAEFLLDTGADIRLADKYGRGPLAWAVARNRAEIVERLITAGANVNAADSSGWPILSQACLESELAVIQRLIESDAVVNAAAPDGWTAMHSAALRGSVEVARLLVEHGCAIDEPDAQGVTPLLRAVLAGRADMVEFLVGAGASVHVTGAQGWSPILAAVRGGHTRIARVLIGEGARTDEIVIRSGSTLLHEAVRAGRRELVQLLLESGLEVNASDRKGRTPLYYAEYHGHREVARLLRDSGARADSAEDVEPVGNWLDGELSAGEAVIWGLAGGAAVRTNGHMLIFSYNEVGALPDEPSLANGRISAGQIGQRKIIYFAERLHPQEWGTRILQMKDQLADARFVLNSSFEGYYAEYELDNALFIDPGQSAAVGQARVVATESYGENRGYCVEVDGLRIFWTLDCARAADNGELFSAQVGLVTAQVGKIDLFITNCPSAQAGVSETSYRGFANALASLEPGAVFLLSDAGAVQQFLMGYMDRGGSADNIHWFEFPGDRYKFSGGRASAGFGGS